MLIIPRLICRPRILKDGNRRIQTQNTLTIRLVSGEKDHGRIPAGGK